MTGLCRGVRHGRQTSIAAVIGGWSVRHRVVAIVGWVAFVVLAMALGSLSGSGT